METKEEHSKTQSNVIYKNPENWKDLFNTILFLDSEEKFHSKITEIFPTWIKVIQTEYSKDYEFLTKNWKVICSMTKVQPRRIILVSFIPENDEPSFDLIRMICEVLTTGGYIVRRNDEFITCSKCERILPSFTTWRKMKETGRVSIPEFSTKCLHC